MLGAIPYSTNRAQLHTDESVLPRHRRARASWNYLVTPGDDHVVVSYDISRLMRIERRSPVPGHPRRPRPGGPFVGARRDDLQPSVVHAGICCGPTLCCRRSMTTGWYSPAPTTAGDSTRTAPHRGCAPPADSAPTGRLQARARPRRRWSRADADSGSGDLPHHDQPLPAGSGASLVRIPQLQLVCRRRPAPPAAVVAAAFRAIPRRRPLRRPTADRSDVASGETSLRERLEAFFADRDVAAPDGRITALLQARVLGYVFNPLSVFWCHDRDGQLRHVIAEVHNTYGGRHAYLLPPADTPVVTARSSTSRRSIRWTATTWCWPHDPSVRSTSWCRCSASAG